jgi:hypothetical protein
VLVSEAEHLPEPERHRTRAAQYAYIAEWVGLLRQVHPQWDAVPARIRVQAVHTMMNDIALTPSLRNRGGVDSALVSIGTALLGTADPAGGVSCPARAQQRTGGRAERATSEC